MSATLSDDEIAKKWKEAVKWQQNGRRVDRGYHGNNPSYRQGHNLCYRIANSIVDELEAAGVTEADIDRLSLAA